MLPPDFPRPDFYIASMGRSGSTMIANWLTSPPERIVLIEPFFFSLKNPQMLREQLDNLDFGPGDEEWHFPDATWQDRFLRLFAPILGDRRWAFKEVLTAEHHRVIDTFAPERVIVTVRDIRDIAGSFLEKHKIQGNVDRLDHDWVNTYCVREAREIVSFCRRLDSRGVPFRILRYEDFVTSAEERDATARFVGWPGGGDVGRHLHRLKRAFEIERHGGVLNTKRRQWTDRSLENSERSLAETIAGECSQYQVFFGY